MRLLIRITIWPMLQLKMRLIIAGIIIKVMKASKHVLAGKVDFQEVDRIFGESGFVAAVEEILRQLELIAQNGFVAPVDMAQRYVMVDQPDKAIEWLEKGFEVRDPNMPYITTRGYCLIHYLTIPGLLTL